MGSAHSRDVITGNCLTIPKPGTKMQHQRRPQQPADSSIHVWRSEGAGMIWMQKPQKRDLEPQVGSKVALVSSTDFPWPIPPTRGAALPGSNYVFVSLYYILLYVDTGLLLLTTFDYLFYHVLLFCYIFVYGQTPPLVLVPSSHYYLGSSSWTSRTLYFPDSRYLLEVLRDFLGRERGGVPRGSSRTLGDPP